MEKVLEVCNVNPNNTENNTNINYINPILSIHTEDEMDEYQAYPYEQKDMPQFAG